MSNDLLHADGLGENDVCTDVIIILGVWDENEGLTAVEHGRTSTGTECSVS